MKKILVVLAVVCVCFPTYLFAQGAAPSLLSAYPTGTEGSGGFGFLSGLRSALGQMMWNPYAQVGYTNMGANFTLPINGEAVPGLPIQVGELDMSFEQADFWTGTIGLNVMVSPQFSFFALAGGVSPRLFVTPGELPISVGPGTISANLEFTASNLEFWYLQTGVGYSIAPGYSIIGGFYWNRLSIELGDPRRRGGAALANQTLRGDLAATVSVPFIGLQITDSSYVGILSYSPLASADVKLALRNSQTGPEELRYSWNRPGDYIAVYFQYNATPPPVVFSLFVNGGWLSIRGGGELELDSPTAAIPYRAKESVATMGMYSIGYGIGLGVMF